MSATTLKAKAADAKANEAEPHALATLEALKKQLAAAQAALAEKDATIATLSHRKAFTLRDLARAVMADLTISIEALTKLATEHGQEYKPDTIRMTRKQTLDFIADAKLTGHWQD